VRHMTISSENIVEWLLNPFAAEGQREGEGEEGGGYSASSGGGRRPATAGNKRANIPPSLPPRLPLPFPPSPLPPRVERTLNDVAFRAFGTKRRGGAAFPI
jgi:hypothetical protein